MRILEILTPDPANITEYYQELKLYKAASENGIYAAISGGAVRLAANQSVYAFVDNSGLSTDFYKFTYNRTTAPTAESEQYPLGQYYATATSLKNRLNETGEDAAFVEAIISATDQVRRYCRRDFSQKIETRYFEGPLTNGVRASQTYGPKKLFIDDLLSVSSIVIDYSGGQTGSNTTTLTLNTHCYLWPQDALQRQEPYEGLAFIPTATLPANTGGSGGYTVYNQGLYWPRGYQAVRITGTWGWPVNPLTNSPVPAAVREATLQIAARIYKGRDNAYSRVTGNADMGTLQIRDGLFNKDVLEMLRPYRKEQEY